MEPRSKRRKLTLENKRKTKDVNVNFDSLPDDVLRTIFNYLSISEIMIFSRVCEKWKKLLRDPDPIFWKKVVVLFQSHRNLSSYERTDKLLRILPKYVTCLKLYYDDRYKQIVLIVSEISLLLLENCPNLEELVILNAGLDTEEIYIIDLSEAFSKKLRMLKLREARGAPEEAEEIELTFEKSYESKIEVFDISYGLLYIARTFLSQMPCLTQLYLAGKTLENDFFDSNLNVIRKLKILDFQLLGGPVDTLRHFLQIVRENCRNLIELYVCFNDLEDEDVRLLNATTVLPNLKVICLRACGVSYTQIDSLIDSKPCLEIVYVGTKADPKYDKKEYNYDLCKTPAKVIRRLNVTADVDCEHDEECPRFRNEL